MDTKQSNLVVRESDFSDGLFFIAESATSNLVYIRKEEIPELIEKLQKFLETPVTKHLEQV